MKKSYIVIAGLAVLAVGVFYFWGPGDENIIGDGKNTITIPEGIQSQFGDLRIGVASIKEKAEYVDSEGNPIDAGSAPASAGPVARLAIADPESSSKMS